MQGTVSPEDFLWAALDEVYEKFLRLSQLVDDRESELPFHSAVRLVDSFRTEIAKKLDEVEKLAKRLWSLPTVDKGTASTFWLAIGECASDFLRLHDSFRWFSNPWVTETTYRFLQACFKEPEGGANYLYSLNGSLAYTPIYNFGFASVDEYFSSHDVLKTVAWELPYAEQHNPLMWPILLHEVGHAVVQQMNLVPHLARVMQDGSDKAARWFEELGADHIAARILGPAYYFSLGSLAFFLQKGNLRSSRQDHPATVVRFDAIERTLRLCGVDPDKPAFSAVARFRDLINQRKEIEQTLYGSETAFEDADWEERGRQIVEIIAETVRAGSLAIGMYSPPPYQHACSLSDKMMRGEMIASYRDEGIEDDVKKAVRAFRSGDIKVDDLFQQLVPLNETPAGAVDIVVAGWISRIKRMPRTRDILGPGKDGGRDEIRDVIRETDRLLQKSLEVSVVHSAIAS